MPTKVQQKEETSKEDLRNNLYLLLQDFHGAVDEVARRTGYHRETIRLTFLGRRKKSLGVVLETASLVIKERKEMERRRMENVRLNLAEL